MLELGGGSEDFGVLDVGGIEGEDDGDVIVGRVEMEEAVAGFGTYDGGCMLFARISLSSPRGPVLERHN